MRAGGGMVSVELKATVAQAKKVCSSFQVFSLAESLGAQTSTLSGTNAAVELMAFARERNVSKVVVGKTGQSRWREALLGSFVNNLVRLSGDIDVYVIRGDSDSSPQASAARAELPGAGRAPGQGRSVPERFLGAAGIVAACTLLGLLAFQRLDLANIAMIYLAGVPFEGLDGQGRRLCLLAGRPLPYGLLPNPVPPLFPKYCITAPQLPASQTSQRFRLPQDMFLT